MQLPALHIAAGLGWGLAEGGMARSELMRLMSLQVTFFCGQVVLWRQVLLLPLPLLLLRILWLLPPPPPLLLPLLTTTSFVLYHVILDFKLYHFPVFVKAHWLIQVQYFWILFFPPPWWRSVCHVFSHHLCYYPTFAGCIPAMEMILDHSGNSSLEPLVDRGVGRLGVGNRHIS